MAETNQKSAIYAKATEELFHLADCLKRDYERRDLVIFWDGHHDCKGLYADKNLRQSGEIKYFKKGDNVFCQLKALPPTLILAEVSGFDITRNEGTVIFKVKKGNITLDITISLNKREEDRSNGKNN